MDLELEHEIIQCYETVGQASICQEETQEAIVPDACPDILRIADVCAQAFPSRWEAREGQAAVFGFIQAAVLYIPEDENILRRMDVKIPFSVQTDLPAATPDCTLEVSARLRCVDGRILNPRKILLRADLVTEITAHQRKEYQICTGARYADNEKLCQKQSKLNYERIVSVPQRIFPMSEEIRLPGTNTPSLLFCRGESVCTESRVIGTKLIFKGKTDVVLLLQNEDGSLERRCESFPFSQILEAKGAGENSISQVRLELAELNCRQSSEDPFHLILETEVLAQGQIRECDTATLLSDLYSTTSHTELEKENMVLYAPGDQQILPQTIRDLLETEDVVRGVCDSRFDLGVLQHLQEGDTLCITAHGQVVVNYLDENRQLRHLEKPIDISVRLHSPQSCYVHCHCLCSGDLFAAPCIGGIEVRLNVEFHILTARLIQTSVVRQAKLGEGRCSDGTRPSVILRLPQQGEDLWDIAKSCGTTMSRIIQANELTNEEIPQHKMLLIPNAR